MKRIFALLTALILTCSLAACGGAGTQSNPQPSQPTQSTPPVSSLPDDGETVQEDGQSTVLVAYFSATGNTEGIAQHLQAVLDADLYEIVPEDPYTDEDLNYSSDGCRANQEQNDPTARPAISGTLEQPERYDVVFLGYPIWWGQAPKILYTFLERYDFGDATIIPFCTSGSSGISGSLADLQALASGARWLDGQRFASGASEEEVAQWVNGLGLTS